MTEVFGEKAIVSEAVVINRQFENTKPSFFNSHLHYNLVENETGLFRIFDEFFQEFQNIDFGTL